MDVECVCPDEATAETIAEHTNCRAVEVKFYAEVFLPVTTLSLSAAITDGVAEDWTPREDPTWPDTQACQHYVHEASWFIPQLEGVPGRNKLGAVQVRGFQLRVYGIDHERVRKVFSEKRAELIARSTNGEPV